jgi:PEGA domain-containing protein
MAQRWQPSGGREVAVSQLQSHSDPLLEFSTELDVSSPGESEPEQVVESPVLPETPSSVEGAPDEGLTLRNRVDQLEKALAQSAEEIRNLRSEVATLVTLRADIPDRTRRPVAVVPFPSVSSTPRATRVISAIAGIVLGISIGLWFWRATDSTPLAPPAAVAIASERAPAPVSTAVPAAAAATNVPVQPKQPAAAPPAPATIVPAAVVTPAHSPPQRPPRQVEYVGTLTIDSDPAGNVLIDRKPAGRTPLRAADLKAGSHLIWIEQDGYRRFTRVVQVPADRVTRLVANLEPEQR